MKRLHRRLLTIAAAALLLPGIAPAAPRQKTVVDISRTISDESIIFPESFETNTQKLLEGWYMKNYTATDDRYSKLPDVPVSDEVLIKRLQAIPAVVELPYNPIVRKYIERYTKGGRAQVAAMLGLSNYYMPIFEQALEQEGLPLELKYLPIIESALDPNAVSRSGAAGLWQFILSAAKGLGLEVNSLVDERRDPYLSSSTAARFLKDLYATYGDWSLVIAAYNCGPGTVNKAIRRAGGDPRSHNFWTIYNYLPAETRGYVPAFIAATYVMNYYRDHNISPVLATKPLVTDTVGVTQRVHFDQISHVLNIPVEELRVLNPQFRKDIIPGRPDAPYFLILPSQQIHAYILSEGDILAYNADQYKRMETATTGAQSTDDAIVPPTAEETAFEQDLAQVQSATPASAPQGSRTIIHKVQPQESIASIAARYNVQPEQIKEWNSLRRNSIRTGQQLRIITGGQPVVAQNTKPAPSQPQEGVAQGRSRHAQPEAAQPVARQTPAPKAAKASQQTAHAESAPTARRAKGKKTAEEQTAQRTGKKGKKNKERARKTPPKPTSVNVRNGDSLERIAKREGTTVEALKKANNLSGDNPVIQPGQKLKMPKNAKGAKAEPASAKKSKKGKKGADATPSKKSKKGKKKR